MNPKKQNNNQVNEPVSVYKPIKKQGIDENFDFYKEFKNGFTLEEAKAEMHKRIAKWDWKK